MSGNEAQRNTDRNENDLSTRIYKQIQLLSEQNMGYGKVVAA